MNLEAEAEEILNFLISKPFQESYPLSRGFKHVPTNPALYAVCHRLHGILYLGQSLNLRRRFRDGHKALSWAFIDRFDPDDVRIAAKFLLPNQAKVAKQIEALMIRSTQPSYNSLIK
jgi:excinuclease UvrABC nuclease subunit